MYHYVRNIQGSAFPGIKGLEVGGFKRQLDYLTSEFNMISPEELVNFAVNCEALPDKPCLLTFDDGYKDHFDHVLPELLKRQLKAAFFPPGEAIVNRKILNVNSVQHILACSGDPTTLVRELNRACVDHGLRSEDLDVLWRDLAFPSRHDPKEVIYIKRMLQHRLPENLRNEITKRLFEAYVSTDPKGFADDLYMSFDEVKSMVDSGMYVGSHSMGHHWLDKLSRREQSAEIARSVDFLNTVGAPTQDWIMCYPFGAYNDDTLAVLSEQDGAVGLTTRPAAALLDSDDILELPRYDTNDFPQ
jgi:hypothetical protein